MVIRINIVNVHAKFFLPDSVFTIEKLKNLHSINLNFWCHGTVINATQRIMAHMCYTSTLSPRLLDCISTVVLYSHPCLVYIHPSQTCYFTSRKRTVVG